MTQGSNSRIGIAAGRVAAGAKVEAVMSNSLGNIASPVETCFAAERV
jgi:hypothetical protein